MSTYTRLVDRVVAEGAARAVMEVAADELIETAGALLGARFRLALVAAHDTGGPLRVVYLFTAGPPDRRIELHVAVERQRLHIPSLAHLSFPASRFEREMRDLFGIEPLGHPQPRRLVLHQHWPSHWHPLRADAGPAPAMVDGAAPYPFVDVEGPGIYEIPVGPVHAGLIEPGHFRFFVMGETIIKMKARLWFVHKGIERLFEGQDFRAAIALAERISGDSAIGHSLSYTLAVEEACGIEVPPRAQELRAVLLELERLYNHVADVGALCNDVGFGLANAHALTLREALLRLNAEVTGHRLLRGAIVPGGAHLRRMPLLDELKEIGERFHEIVDLARSNTIVMDRFAGTAVLSSVQAEEIGVIGVVARASGLPLDGRLAHPFIDPPADFRTAGRQSGDVLARFLVRCDEFDASLALLESYLGREGSLAASVLNDNEGGDGHGGAGSGIVEGWRGTIVHRVEVDPTGTLRRVKVVDPSFLNWPALPVALADTIVPDFPLANKSFNLSYAGNDL
jgi:Ni,Fe-hydrogenase III large subunit/Ni,Fe-hydrogenase III component G